MGAPRLLVAVAAVLAVSSLHAAPDPDVDRLSAAGTIEDVRPLIACHLGLCLRRGPSSCQLAQTATVERAEVAGARFEHQLVLGDAVSSKIAASSADEATQLPLKAFVAELIPIAAGRGGSFTLQPRYSTDLRILDDQLTLRTSAVVLDPGRYQLVHGLAEAGGLAGSYFDNTGLQGEPALQRVDKIIDFDWGLGPVAGLASADYVAARWCGYLGVADVPMARKLPNGDKYVLWLDLGAETDGARLWLNGTLLIDAWERGKERLPSANVQLKAGTLNGITLQYRHVKGHAAIRLLWSSPWATLQPVPSRNLFNVHAVGQPVLLNVDHGRLFNSSLLVGQGLSILSAGATVQFKMSAMDAYGNAARSLQGGKLLLHTLYAGAHAIHKNESALTIQPSIEAVSDLIGGFEGLVRVTTAGTWHFEAFYGASGALSATYYTTNDLVSFVPAHTSLWHGALTSVVSSQPISESLAFREGLAARWAGFIKVPNASDFAMYTKVESARERMKLWVDNILIINQWNSLDTLQPSGTFTPFSSDALYSIALEYHDGLNSLSSELSNPGLSLEWESPAGSGMHTPKTVVPKSSFFSAMTLAQHRVEVQPARADPKTSKLESTQAATSGSAHDFHIQIRDEFGNTAPTHAYNDNDSKQCASESLEALLDQGTVQIEATLRKEIACSSCALPERLSGSATPLISGVGSVWALLGGFHIQGSPMPLDVHPGTTVGSRSDAHGNGLSLSTAGVQAEFKMFARDEHGNLARPDPPGRFAVKITRKDSDLRRPRYAGIEYEKAHARVDMYPLDMGMLDRVPQQQDVSSWKLAFLLTHSGEYTVDVKWAGEHVSGSPFSCNVTYSSTCAAQSFVSGHGLSISTAGTPAVFSIHARDEYSNVLNSVAPPSRSFFIPILYSPKVRPQHLGFKADDRAVHAMQFTTTRGGQNSLHVSLASVGGLSATYFSDPNLAPASSKETVSAGQVVDWSSQAGNYRPEWNSRVARQQYGARWTGLLQVTATTATTYTFYNGLRTATERVKLWIDTALVVDQWTSLASLRPSGSINFAPQTGFYDIMVEYHDMQRFNTTQRGLTLEVDRNGVHSKLTNAFSVKALTNTIPHRTFSAAATASQSRVYGSGLTLLTAGVSSQLTLVAKDVYGNLIDGVVPWIQFSAEPNVPYAHGNTLSISTTVSGSFDFEVKLLQFGGLQATFYSDTYFSQSTASGAALSDLGLLRIAPIESAIDQKSSYYSVRWRGYLSVPLNGDYTFFADNSVANRLVIDGIQVFDYVPTTLSSAFGTLSISNESQPLPYGLSVLYEMRHASGVLAAASGLDLVFTSTASSESSRKAPVHSAWLTFEAPAANTPFTAAVMSAHVCASRSIPYGSGLTVVTAGRLAIFFVQSKDEFSNNIVSQFTTCTTSSYCASGLTLGILSYFQPISRGVQSRRVISSYNSDGVWDMLVIAITISGKYNTDISLAYVGGLAASYCTTSDAPDLVPVTPSVMQHNTQVFVNVSSLPNGVINSNAGFTVEWEGLISIPCRTEDSCTEFAKESFTFESVMTPADRVKLWLDNRLVIDQWSSLVVASPTGTIGLDESDRLWRIHVEYKHTSNATGIFDFKWRLNTAGSTYVSVPSTNLYKAAAVGASPYSSRVWPAVAAGDFLSFSAMTVLTAGVSSYFTFTARDRFNNPRDFRDLFTFKTQQGSTVPFFTPTIENGTTTDGLFYATGIGGFTQTQAADYSSKLFFLSLGGFMATYYDSSSFIYPKRATVVKKVDLCPTTGCGTQPLSSNLNGNTPFSVSFDGAIKPMSASIYKLKVTVNDPSDRVRLWFDNALIIDQWESLAATTLEVDVSMMLANAHYDLTISYRHVLVGIGYGCRLEWKASTDSAYAIIPSAYMYQRYSSPAHHFTTVPSSTCYSTSTATGVGLTLATAGLRNVFTITSRDEYSNAATRDNSRFIALVGKGDTGLLSEASEFGSFKSVHVSSKVNHNPMSVAACRIGGLTQEYYDNARLQGVPAISKETQGPIDFSWGQHVLPWRTGTSSSIQWHGFLRADSRVGMGLMATYYSDASLDPSMAMKAVGESGSGPIDFSQTAAQGMSVPDGTMYSIRWSGFLRPTYSQSYTFHSHLTRIDDRVKLWIDGTLLIDQWTSLLRNVTSSAGVSLTEDTFHSVAIEYAHAGGSNTSGLSLFWSARRFSTKILADSFLLPKNYSAERLEYTFHASKMQNAVLTVADTVIINTSSAASMHEARRMSGTFEMETGVLYKIRLQYSNAPTAGRALLEWSTPNRPVPRIVEALQLFFSPIPSDHISGSPFEIFSVSAAPDPSQSTVRMISQSDVQVGSAVTFQLNAFDTHHNTVPSIPDPIAFLVVLSLAPKLYYSYHTTQIVSMSFRHQTTLLTHQSDDSFSGSISTTTAGTHTAYTWLALPGGLSATFYSDSSLAAGQAEQSSVWEGPLDWSSTSPSIGAFSQTAARWSGFVRPDASGMYNIKTVLQSSEERVKLWVDGLLLIDDWNSLKSLSLDSAIIFPAAMSYYEIIVEYRTSSHWQTRGLSLMWKAPSSTFVAISSFSLFSAHHVDPEKPPFQANFLPTNPLVWFPSISCTLLLLCLKSFRKILTSICVVNCCLSRRAQPTREVLVFR